MPSAFDAEFLSVAAPELDAQFGESATYRPADRSRAAYTITATFETPLGDRDGEAPVEVHSEMYDVVTLTGGLRFPLRTGDQITRAQGEETLTYRVVPRPGKPDNEPDDGGEIYRRIRVQRVRTGS